jgi:hypothetical protein
MRTKIRILSLSAYILIAGSAAVSQGRLGTSGHGGIGDCYGPEQYEQCQIDGLNSICPLDFDCDPNSFTCPAPSYLLRCD